MGFISGFNRYVLAVDSDIAPGKDVYAFAAWMDIYCKAHPLNSKNAKPEVISSALTMMANCVSLRRVRRQS